MNITVSRHDFKQAVSNDLKTQAIRNPEEAEPKLHNLLKENPDNISANRLFTLCLCAQGKHEEALEHSRELLFPDQKNEASFSIYVLALSQAAASGKYEFGDLFEREAEEFKKLEIPRSKLKDAIHSTLYVDKLPIAEI